MSNLRKQRMKERKSRTFRRRIMALMVIVLVVASLGAIYFIYGNRPSSGSTVTKVLLRTSMGNITIQLYDDMPITAGNFKNLIRDGVYDGTTFHRANAYVIQGGNAVPKGITVPPIQDELPNKYSNDRGSVAMAKTSQPDSATSQFYINLRDNSQSYDSNYSVFGTVIAGMSVVDAIGNLAKSDETLSQVVTIIKAEFTT